MVMLRNTKVLNDLLAKHGQGTSLKDKRSVWATKGLDRRLGRYEGTAVQTKALIRSLKNNPIGYTVNINTPEGGNPADVFRKRKEEQAPQPQIANPFSGVVDWAKGAWQGAKERRVETPTEQTPQQTMVGKMFENVGTTNVGGFTLPTIGGMKADEPRATDEPKATDVFNAIKGMGGAYTPYEQQATPTMEAAKAGMEKGQEAAQQAQEALGVNQPEPVQPAPQVAKETAEITPTPEVGKTEIPEYKGTTADDILSAAMEETGVKLSKEEADIEKERIRGELPGKIADVQAKFASKGLFFSGARTAEEQAARDKALADELDVDLRFAKILGTAIDKAATSSGKEYTDFLNDIGLTMNPQTGELYPTLAATKAEQIDENRQLKYDLDIAKFEFNQAKTLQQMENAALKLDLAQAKYTASTKAIPASPGFFNYEVESSIREDADALLLQNGGDKDTAYRRLRNLYSPQEATDEAIKSLVGIEENEGELPLETEKAAKSWWAALFS